MVRVRVRVRFLDHSGTFGIFSLFSFKINKLYVKI